jgi:hypothetical protein
MALAQVLVGACTGTCTGACTGLGAALVCLIRVLGLSAVISDKAARSNSAAFSILFN